MEPHIDGNSGTTFASELGGLRLADYEPQSQLRLRTTEIERPAVRIVDAHAHLGRWLTGGEWAVPDVAAFLQDLESSGVRTVFNFDGRWGAELEANLDRYDLAHPGRFATFCHVDWQHLGRPGGEGRLPESLELSVRAGARGLKVWKDLGLRVRDHANQLVMPNDKRLSDLWESAGHLEVPVAIHTADPVAFFAPVDRTNERLEELLAHPDWSFDSPEYPDFYHLIGALEEVVASHPRTTFLGLHVGCFAEDLGWVRRMLGTYPNFYIEIGRRINELGRQPRAARQLILDFPDRVLFGTDEEPPYPAMYQIHFRFMETDDEYFDYSPESPPPTGRWAISGLHLPLNVLEQVYSLNAERLVPKLPRSESW